MTADNIVNGTPNLSVTDLAHPSVAIQTTADELNIDLKRQSRRNRKWRLKRIAISD
jgi:hypothetical protein